MFVADVLPGYRLNARMLDSKGLIAELHRLRSEGKATNAEIGRLLKLPSSRVAEIFAGERSVKIDEMKVLVERYGLEHSTRPAFNADTLEPLLDAILPLLPAPERMTDQSRRALAEALAYGLALLDESATSQASSGAVAVAARGAMFRLRELMN